MSMRTCLITGGNRGIGLELVKAFAADDWTVFAACRPGSRTEGLLVVDGDVTILEMDVGDAAHVAIVAERMRGIPLDLLINNAGMFGPRGLDFGETDFSAWAEVLAVNVLAPVRVLEAFASQLEREGGGKAITISSQMGSIARNGASENLIYRSSKAAVNQAMTCAANALGPKGVTVAMLHPGWVRTDMGGPSAALEPAKSASDLKKVIDGITPGDNGRFLDHDGSEIPW